MGTQAIGTRLFTRTLTIKARHYLDEPVEATVTVEIDIDRIMQRWGHAALQNKSGRSRCLNGALTVKATKTK